MVSYSWSVFQMAYDWIQFREGIDFLSLQVIIVECFRGILKPDLIDRDPNFYLLIISYF